MSTTNDRNDPGLRNIGPDGMQETYLVLSDEERARGFVRPVRRSYRHTVCGTVTTMGLPIAETYAVHDDFQIARALNGYTAVGCGADLALGSLHTTRENPFPDVRVTKALEAAAHHSSGVAGPFILEETPPAPVGHPS